MRVSRFVVVVAVGAALAACSSGGSAGSGGSTSAPSGTPSSSSAPPARPSPAGGVGSTPTVMAAVHGPAQPATGPCAVPGACYGPPVTNAQNGATYAFTGVTLVDGLVGGYVQNFPGHTTGFGAIRAVLALLPPDAHSSAITTIFGATSSCAFVNITSPTIAALFPDQAPASSVAGFSNTMVGVELSGTDAAGYVMYDPNDVQVAKVTLGADSSSMAC